MSKLDELIQKLCPNGVEFLPLWKCVYFDKRFNGVEKHKQEKVLTFSHVSAEQLKNMECGGEVKLLSTGKFEGYTTKEVANEFLNEGEVISFPSGGSASLKYFFGYFVDSGNILCSTANTEKYNLKFIYHTLLRNIKLIESYYRGSGVKHPEMLKIIEIKIPVPPLEVQEEIVRILDNFTLLTSELTAELTARKQQYEYYRNKLFTFENGIKQSKLSELCNITRGKRVVKSQLSGNGDYPVFQNTLLPMGYFYLSNCDENSTYVVSAGSAGEIGFCKSKSWMADDCLFFKDCRDINNKFIYYYLKSKQEYIKSFVRKASVPRLSREVIENIIIPVPSLEEQQRIVDILDKFDAYCNDLTQGLPAEIGLRKQQYEYYRDKLLSFKELK